MRILVTGAKGFIGKNLVASLKSMNTYEIYEFDLDSSINDLEEFIEKADYIFHLAGINRPENEDDYYKGNFGLTKNIIDLMKKYNKKCPIMISSSIQAELDNPYGKSKRAGEKLLLDFELTNQSRVLIYRFPNVFGKWSKPNYNSVVATFCYNISRDLPITINNSDTVIKLVYIDDVISELIRGIDGKENRIRDYCYVDITYDVTINELARLIKFFHQERNSLLIPDLEDKFMHKLYSCYLSYVPDNNLIYKLETKEDYRGSFTEVLKSHHFGQVSINVSKPGMIKGNHWHHSKTEKFVVVSGVALIRLRMINNNNVLEYKVSGQELQTIIVPPGYVHNIENIGNDDLIVLIWANEIFNTFEPDTFKMEV